MNQQSGRTLLETRTTLAPAEVLSAAKQYFARRHGIYAAFLEQESPTHVALRGQGGEELLIGVRLLDGATAVTGSTYLFDQQITRFFATLPPAPAETAAAPTDEQAPADAASGEDVAAVAGGASAPSATVAS